MTASELTSYDAEGHQFAWDATSLDRADKCQRYLQYKRAGWTHPLGSVHLWFGGLYATALETYHKLMASGTPREDAIREVVKATLISTWHHDRDEQGKRIPGTGSPITYNHETKGRDTLIRTIIWYFEEFKEEPYQTYIRANGVPAVEASFQLPVDNGIVLCGHIDRIAVDHEGNPFVHDQKTSGHTLTPYFWKSYKPGIQFAMYTFAGKAIYNIPVKGVIVDAVQIAVGFSRFARSPIMYTDGELNEWYDDMMLLIEETHRNEQRGYFPMRRSSCGLYGGCEFREVCSRPESVRDNFLRADFVQGPRWDPIKPR